MFFPIHLNIWRYFQSDIDSNDTFNQVKANWNGNTET
jgi:hypothetical protein